MKTESMEIFQTLSKFKRNGFVSLISLMAEDLSPNAEGKDEFKLHYTLYNPVNEAPSVSTLYKSANYDEREIYDLFGIKFKNHPNLKRIFLDENFEGHPLRNDYENASNCDFKANIEAESKE